MHLGKDLYSRLGRSRGVTRWHGHLASRRKEKANQSQCGSRKTTKYSEHFSSLCPSQRTFHPPGTDPPKHSLEQFVGTGTSLQHSWWISKHNNDSRQLHLLLKDIFELCSHRLDQHIWKALDTSDLAYTRHSAKLPFPIKCQIFCWYEGQA